MRFRKVVIGLTIILLINPTIAAEQSSLAIGNSYWFTPEMNQLEIDYNSTTEGSDLINTTYPVFDDLVAHDNRTYREITVESFGHENSSGFYNGDRNVAVINDGGINRSTVIDGWVDLVDYFVLYAENRVTLLENSAYTVENLYDSTQDLRTLMPGLILPYFASDNVSYYEELASNYATDLNDTHELSSEITSFEHNLFTLNSHKTYRINEENGVRVDYLSLEIIVVVNLNTSIVEDLKIEISTDVVIGETEATYNEHLLLGLNYGNQTLIELPTPSSGNSVVLILFIAIGGMIAAIVIYASKNDE